MTVVATAGQTWGGETVGIIAAVLFVLFAAWIVWQRWHRGSDSPDTTRRDTTEPRQEKVER